MSVSVGGGVSVGSAAATEADQELALCWQGGESFVQRISLFASRKRAAEQAEANLALGKEAVTALAEAKRLRGEAEQDRRAAADALAVAAKTKKDADAYAAKRKAEADRLLAQAEAERDLAWHQVENLKVERAACNAAQRKAEDALRVAQKRGSRLGMQLQAFGRVLDDVIAEEI